MIAADKMKSWSVKALLVGFLAAFLSVGMVITTPSTAHAVSTLPDLGPDMTAFEKDFAAEKAATRKLAVDGAKKTGWTLLKMNPWGTTVGWGLRVTGIVAPFAPEIGEGMTNLFGLEEDKDIEIVEPKGPPPGAGTADSVDVSTAENPWRTKDDPLREIERGWKLDLTMDPATNSWTIARAEFTEEAANTSVASGTSAHLGINWTATCKNVESGEVRAVDRYNTDTNEESSLGGTMTSSSLRYDPNSGRNERIFDNAGTFPTGCLSGERTTQLVVGNPAMAVSNLFSSGRSWRAWGPLKDYVATTGDYSMPDGGTYTVRMECVAADGAVRQLVGEYPSGTGRLGVPSCAEHGLGDVAKNMNVTYKAPGSSRETSVLDLKPDTTAFPGCDVSAGNVCLLEVLVDNEVCVRGNADCVDWMEKSKTEPERVKCRYGNREVDIRLCAPLERGFTLSPEAPSREGMDGDPATKPNPNEVGLPNPGTGTDPNPNPNPSGAPSPSPGTGTSPLPGTGENPDSGGCLSKMWSWNPVDWVMVPVECALKATFIPKAETLTNLKNGVNSRLDGAGVRPLVTSLGGIMTEVPSEAQCRGPAVDLTGIVGGNVFYPLDACPGSTLEFLASVGKIIASVSVILGGVIAMIRALSAGFGFDFSMGRGSE